MTTEVVRMNKDVKVSRWLFESGKTYIVDSQMAAHWVNPSQVREPFCIRGNIPADGAEDRTGACFERWIALRQNDHLPKDENGKPRFDVTVSRA